jgi:hypothetical protein
MLQSTGHPNLPNIPSTLNTDLEFISQGNRYSTSKHLACTHLLVDKVISRLLPLTLIKKYLPRNYKALLLPDIEAPNLYLDDCTLNQALDIPQADLVFEWTHLYLNASYKYPIPG